MLITPFPGFFNEIRLKVSVDPCMSDTEYPLDIELGNFK
jgi:hypothetical protein